MFSGCTVPSDSEETEHGSSDKGVSPSARRKRVPANFSGGVDIPEVPGCYLLRYKSLVKVTTITSRSVSHELTA